MKFVLREEQSTVEAATETNYLEATTQAVTNATQQFQSVKMNGIYESLDKAEYTQQGGNKKSSPNNCKEISF